LSKELELSESLFEKELDVLLEGDQAKLVGLWLQADTTQEDKQKSAQTLRNSGWQFDRMKRILKQMYREAQGREENFNSPNWRDHAAFQLGYKKALRDVYRLIPKTTKE
jgi:hypothetical protein